MSEQPARETTGQPAQTPAPYLRPEPETTSRGHDIATALGCAFVFGTVAIIVLVLIWFLVTATITFINAPRKTGTAGSSGAYTRQIVADENRAVVALRHGGT